MNNRYLVAKYVPDIKRMEPENIGIFLWVNGSVQMRFLRDKDVPNLADAANYNRWLDFWRVQITSQELAPLRGEAVARTNPKYMDVLRSTQEGNYLLFDGGQISSNVEQHEMDDAINFLFDDIVSRKRVAEESDTLTELADHAIHKAGVYDRMERQYSITCKILGTSQQVTVNYAIVENDAVALLQRVSLSRQQAAMSTAMFFNSVTHQRKSGQKPACASLINSADAKSDNLIKLLGKVSTVIDLADETAAIKKIRSLAQAA